MPVEVAHRLVWDEIGKRIFETGIDHGVLYIGSDPGVPWNGLVSVSEHSANGEVTPYYIDGVKYLNHVTTEEFEATIEAYTYPAEFAQCDGTLEVNNGLFATQQPKVPFGLSYRTLIGNDTEGIDFAYKIHLVYGATVAPSQQDHHTIGETIEPDNFTWDIVTKPPLFTGYRPTAHFAIDSRVTPTDLIADLMDILYGTDTAYSRLPSISELISLFNNYQVSILDGGVLGDIQTTDTDAGGAPVDPDPIFIDGGVP